MGQRIESRTAIEKRIRTSLENLVFALGEAAGADRSSLFVVDEERAELRLALAKTGNGRTRGEPIRMDDAYACQRFNPDLDTISGSRTQSVLRIPVRGIAGRVSGVLELRNAIDRPGFSAEDEREISAYEPELSALLGACRSVA